MELSAALLAVMLVTQVAQPPKNGAPAAAAPTRQSPLDLVTAAVRLPADTSGRYQAIGLLDVLKDAPSDPNQRLAAVQSYWRLWKAFSDQAVATKNLARLKPLAQIEPGTVEATLVTAEQAAAQAQLAQADLTIREEQVTLCGLLGWNPSGSMPRPVDTPHVGTYATYYESIYQRRTPTERVLLIHQTLPIYQAALNAHGTARQAADDMVAALEASFGRQELNLESLLAAWQAHSREQRELCRVALVYNEMIAEYAVPLGQDKATPELVSMLIRSGGPTASRRNPRADMSFPTDTAVEQVDYTEAAPETTDMAPGELDGAPQQWPPTGDGTTTSDEQYNGGYVEGEDAAPIEAEGSYPAEVPAETPPADETIQQDPFPAYDGSARYQGNLKRHFAAKAVVETAAAPIYSGALATNAAPRALIEKMLSRTMIGDQGETRLPLSKCLGAVAPTRYGELIDAYVAAWRAASLYQADADSLAQIQDAQATLIKRLEDPNMAEDMLVLRAAETSYWAKLIEDEAEIWRGMKQLGAIALPRQADAKALPVDEPPVWAAATGALSEAALTAQGRGMVAVDAARSQACQEMATVAGLTGLTLQAIERQNEESRGFIELSAKSARENGAAILAQLGPNVSATAAHGALMGTVAKSAARPSPGSQYRP
jgi:hypothetical protein